MGKDAYARGVLGEVRAEQYLAQQGYAIIKRNYRVPGAEIDLIAVKGQLIVFVEVKTRKGGAALGRLAVSAAKQRRVSVGALRYMAQNGWLDRQARFDVIEIQGDQITHIPNAFPYQGPMF